MSLITLHSENSPLYTKATTHDYPERAVPFPTLDESSADPQFATLDDIMRTHSINGRIEGRRGFDRQVNRIVDRQDNELRKAERLVARLGQRLERECPATAAEAAVQNPGTPPTTGTPVHRRASYRRHLADYAEALSHVPNVAQAEAAHVETSRLRVEALAAQQQNNTAENRRILRACGQANQAAARAESRANFRARHVGSETQRKAKALQRAVVGLVPLIVENRRGGSFHPVT